VGVWLDIERIEELELNLARFQELYMKYQPVQNPEEFLWLIEQVEKTQPKCIVEIGVRTSRGTHNIPLPDHGAEISRQ
jgi:DNA polymerase II large subunit